MSCCKIICGNSLIRYHGKILKYYLTKKHSCVIVTTKMTRKENYIC